MIRRYVLLVGDDPRGLLRLTSQAGILVTLLITDYRGSRAQDRAEDQGIPTLYHPLDWYTLTGRSHREYEDSLYERIMAETPDQLVIDGFSHALSEGFLARLAPIPIER